MQRILNYYPNYPTHRFYFGEVETPYTVMHIFPSYWHPYHLYKYMEKQILSIYYNYIANIFIPWVRSTKESQLTVDTQLLANYLHFSNKYI